MIGGGDATHGGMAERAGPGKSTIADGYGTVVTIIPAWRVYGFGATLCVALSICSSYFCDRGGPYFMASLTVAGIAYLFAIREFFAAPRFARRVVVYMVG